MNNSYVFISYAHADRERVLLCLEAMEKSDINIWYDEGIAAGSEWPEYIAEKVALCTRFVLFVSNSYLESQNCKRELNFAISRNKEILTIYLENVNLTNGMEMQLGTYQAVFKNRFKSDFEFYTSLCGEAYFDVCRKSNNDLETEMKASDLLENDVETIKVEDLPCENKWLGYMFMDDTLPSALLSIVDVFDIKNRGTVAVGTILRGRISVGDTLDIVGLSYEIEQVKVVAIECQRKILDYAEIGDNVGLLVKAKNPSRKGLLSYDYKVHMERGQVLATQNSIYPYSVFECKIKADLTSTSSNELKMFSKFQFDFGSTDITGTIESITNSGKGIQTMMVSLIAPIALEEGYGFRILTEDANCISTGVISKLIR